MKKSLLILCVIFSSLFAQDLIVEVPRALLTINNITDKNFQILINGKKEIIKKGAKYAQDLPLKILSKTEMALGNPAKMNPSHVAIAQIILISGDVQEKDALELSFARGLIFLNNKYKLEANAYLTFAKKTLTGGLGGYIKVIDKQSDEYILDTLPAEEYYSLNLILKPDLNKSQIDLGIRIK